MTAFPAPGCQTILRMVPGLASRDAIRQRLQELGMTVVAGGPEAYAGVIRAELESYGKMVDVAGLRGE